MVIDEKNIEQSIARYFMGIADANEREEVLKWAESDEENKKTFLRYKNIWEGTHTPFNKEDIDTASAYEQIFGSMDEHTEENGRSRFSIVRFAAVMALPLAFFSIWSGIVLMKAKSEAEHDVTQTTISPIGAMTRLSLSDGSTVWLNSGSSLEYPARFRKKERTVNLKGEAYFEVAASPDRPFKVNAGKIDVTATGTEFNINAFPSDSLATVSLSKGHLDVSHFGSPLSLLEPGEKLCFNETDCGFSIVKTDVQNDCLWKDGVLVFNNVRLEDVFKRLGQLYGIRFSILDPDLSDNIFRGTFDSETVNEILSIIAMTSPVSYRIGGTDISLNENLPSKPKSVDIIRSR